MNPMDLSEWSVVGSRPGGFQDAVHTDTGRCTRTEHYATDAFTLPRIVYHNIRSGSTAIGNSIVVRSSLEYPSGTAVRVTWGGREDANGGITIPDGGYVISDPIPVRIAAGTTFWCNQLVVPSGGLNYPKAGLPMPQTATVAHTNTTLFPATPVENVEVGTTDRTLTLAYAGGSERTAVLNGVATYAPWCVLGIPETKRSTVAVYGPSSMHGFNDTLGATVGSPNLDRVTQGWVGAVLDRRVPWVSYGANGQGFSAWTSTAAVSTDNARKRLLGVGDIAVVQMGLADLSNDAYTVAQCKTMASAFFDILDPLYSQIHVVCDIVPTASSDSWVTVANQTRRAAADAFGPVASKMEQLSDWLMTYPHRALTSVTDLGEYLQTLKVDGTTVVNRAGIQSDVFGHMTRTGNDMAARFVAERLGTIR